MLNPDLVSLVTTVHMVYARSEIFKKETKELRVGSEQFHASVNGLSGRAVNHYVTPIFLRQNYAK